MDHYIASAKHSNEYFKFLNSRSVKKYANWDEYFVDLHDWFNQQVYIWNLTAKFPYYLAQKEIAYKTRNQSINSQNETVPPVGSSTTTRIPTEGISGIECQIPPLWKRVVAEFIDFLILFFFKLAVTFIAVDFYDLVDWDKFGDDFLQSNSKLEYKAVLKMTHGIVLLELVHRIVVVAFETYWLSSGSQGKIGGATPGKAVMGLRVVRCDSSEDLPRSPTADPNSQQPVLIRPGSDLGFQASFLRALVKNIVLTLFIPASFALLYFRHNRTCYDMMCNSIVVEEPIVRHDRPHQQ